MSRSKTPAKRVIASLIVLGLPALLALRIWTRPEQAIPRDQPIQFDDFAFTVRGVRTAKALGHGDREQTAQGRFYVVTLEVANRAKRVSYQFKNSGALLVDDLGREHSISIPGQNVLNATRGTPDPCSAPLPAGTTATTELVFDVPAEMRTPRLRLSFGGRIGDALDAVIAGKRSFRLD